MLLLVSSSYCGGTVIFEGGPDQWIVIPVCTSLLFNMVAVQSLLTEWREEGHKKGLACMNDCGMPHLFPVEITLLNLSC